MAVPRRITWAVEQLAAAERILEIGCGGGHALALIRARFPAAEIIAIDRSALQVSRARELVGAGRLRVKQMELADAPGVLGAFDAVLAVNVNAFWTAPAPSLASLARLLRPGGRAYLVYEPPSASRLADVRTRLTASLAEYGFDLEGVRETALGGSHAVCMVALAYRRDT